MKKIFTKIALLKITFLLTLCMCVSSATAQKLYLNGGRVDMNVSTKVSATGATSSRIIVNSSLKLSYTTNMGDIPIENIDSGIINGLISDTIYFFLSDFDNTRNLIINAEGYSPATTGALKLSSKSTYIYTVTTPTSFSQLQDSGDRAKQEHRYELAANLYTQALTAEGAPEDLSAIKEYIRTMEACDKHLTYAKKCLVAAKKIRDDSQTADLRKVKMFYGDALRAYRDIKAYMNDDRYNNIIEKIEEAIASLPLVIEGVVEDAASTMTKLSGVNVYAMTSEDDKSPKLLTTTNVDGHFHIELSQTDRAIYKILFFDPNDLKGYKKPKQLNISTIRDHTKVRVKLYK